MDRRPGRLRWIHVRCRRSAWRARQSTILVLVDSESTQQCIFRNFIVWKYNSTLTLIHVFYMLRRYVHNCKHTHTNERDTTPFPSCSPLETTATNFTIRIRDSRSIHALEHCKTGDTNADAHVSHQRDGNMRELSIWMARRVPSSTRDADEK